MAPAVGLWRFMDDVCEMTIPMANLDWHKTPTVNPVALTVDSVQKDATQPAEVPSLGQSSPTLVNTSQLIEDLNKQNKELLIERTNAIKWQDAASMAIKEAKDEAEDARAAKKARVQAAVKVHQQLNDSRSLVAALKKDKSEANSEKNRTEAELRRGISSRIDELQTKLISAIRHGRGSIEAFEELFQLSQNMHNELVAKDREVAAKEKENQELQDRFNARNLVFNDIREDARKSREACDKSRREKVKSERAAERTVGELRREVITVKATTDRAMKSMQTQVTESEARVMRANTRAIKAEGDVEELRRDLTNTESARQMFEKKDGQWAARFAAIPTLAAGSSSLNTGNTVTAAESETSTQIPITTTDEVKVSKVARDPSRKPKAEEWKRNTRHELEEQNKRVLATERRKMRQELEEENKKALAGERKSIRRNVLKAQLVMKLKSRQNKQQRKVRQRAALERVRSKKAQVNWKFAKAKSPPTEVDRSQLEAHIRGQLQTEWQGELANHKTQWETEYAAIERPRLVTQIRSELQTEWQSDLAEHKTRWQTQFVDLERPQLEGKIRAELQDEYEDKLSEFKTSWEAEHPLSEAGPSSQSAESGNPIEIDDAGAAASATVTSSVEDMVVASLSRESDETHLLFQEIAAAGLTQGQAPCTVLRELNKAKDVLYDIKCELRKPDAVADKNNLLQSVRGVHVSEHYIRKLNTTARKVLIRQANEANERLEYVKNILRSNDDVPKYATLKYLLEPLETGTEQTNESEHRNVPEYPQIANGHGGTVPEYPQIANGYTAAGGPSDFAQMINNARYSTVASPSAFTTVIGPASSAAPGTSTSLPTANPFGNLAVSSRSGSSTNPQPFNGFGPPPAPMIYHVPNKGVINPFETTHFDNQPSLDSTPSQNNQGGPASEGATETKTHPNSKFKKTFGPVLPQGEGLASPVSVNSTAGPKPNTSFGNKSSNENASDKDHEMDTVGSQPSPSVTMDQSGAAGVGSVSSPLPRKIKLPQSQRRQAVPKGRQLAQQAFGEKQNASPSVPAQTPQINPQDQVPATGSGSFGVPRTAFTLEPNHAFDLTSGTSLANCGSHLRAQQDPAEYQKPLKLFKIPEKASPASEQREGTTMSRESKNTEQSPPSEPMPSQAEDLTPESPPGCEGWTNDMETHARNFLIDADIDQVQIELYLSYPSTEHMTGLSTHLQKLKQEIQSAEPDQPQSEQTTPEQPIGWTPQMTEFVEGSLCGGNDVHTTVTLFKNEIPTAFDIQGLDAHLEKLRNGLLQRSHTQAQQEQVVQEPLGWNEGMTAIIQGYLRKGDTDVELMVQSLEVVEPDALFVDGVSEYVTTLLLRFQIRGYVETG